MILNYILLNNIHIKNCYEILSQTIQSRYLIYKLYSVFLLNINIYNLNKSIFTQNKFSQPYKSEYV